MLGVAHGMCCIPPNLWDFVTVTPFLALLCVQYDVCLMHEID